MGNYNHSHILRLKQEAQTRFTRLQAVLTPSATVVIGGKEVVGVSSYEVRLAVDDFRFILTEIRRLK